MYIYCRDTVVKIGFYISLRAESNYSLNQIYHKSVILLQGHENL